MSDSAARQWTLVLVLTALFLSLVVLAQTLARYGAAYWAAPREISALLDSADSSLQENESYDRDVAKVPRLDDKMRLGRLLREIQRAGDDLREDLNAVLVGGGDGDDDDDDNNEPSEVDSSNAIIRSPRLKATARVLWAAHRTRLEERLRRLDLLRMRFLVVYMSIVAATATAAAEKVEKSAVIVHASACSSATGSSIGSSPASSMPASPRSDPEKAAAILAASYAAAAVDGIYGSGAGGMGSLRYADTSSYPASSPPPPPPPPPAFDDWPGSPRTPSTPSSSSAAAARHHAFLRSSTVPSLPEGLLESIRRKPPLRRVSTLGPRRPSHSSAEGSHRSGWMGVVQELQRSPLLHKRHASVELSTAASSLPASPAATLPLASRVPSHPGVPTTTAAAAAAASPSTAPSTPQRFPT